MIRGAARELWIAGFLVAVFAPIVLRLAAVERQSFAQELVTVTGLLATSLLVCAVVLPARMRSLTRAFGIEKVLGSHRLMGLSAAVAALVHVGAVVLADPRNAALLAFLAPAQTATPFLAGGIKLAPLRAVTAVLAVACLVALVWLAARRRGRYEVWRGWHVVLTFGTLAGTAWHVVLIGHLVPTAGLAAWLSGDPAAGVVLAGKLTTDPSGAAFLAVLAVVVLAVGARRWLLRPLDREGRYRVARVHEISPTVTTLTLRRDGAGALTFRPGQFAWLRLARDPFVQEHPFTISSAVQDGHEIEFVIRHAGDWTTGPMRRLREGDFVWLDGPHGALTPDASAAGIVLVAGGVGITPMMSILRSAARQGDRRPIRLLLTDRPGEGLFREELGQLRTELALEVHELHRAPLTAELFADLLPPTFLRGRLDYFVCGPPSLVRDTVAALGALDIPAQRVHTEQFHA